MSNLILVVVVVLALAGAALVLMGGGKAKLEEVQAFLDDDAKIVDVRSAAEFASGHHPLAVNIPVDQIASRSRELGEDGKIVVYCRSGARSARAAQILRQKGYEVLDAGIRSRIP